jgi:hypothetical protein
MVRAVMVDSSSMPAGTTLGLVERVAALHRVDLFASVPGRVLAAVAEASTEVRAAPGDALIT